MRNVSGWEGHSSRAVVLLPVRNGTFVRLTPSRRRRLSWLPDRGKAGASGWALNESPSTGSGISKSTHIGKGRKPSRARGGLPPAGCSLHPQRSRPLSRRSCLTLSQSRLTLRWSWRTVRQSWLTSWQCYLTLRRCKPTLPRGNHSGPPAAMGEID